MTGALRGRVAVAGIGASDYFRHGGSEETEFAMVLRAVLAAASDAGRRAAQVMAGAVLMLVCAGLLEGYGRQLVTAPAARAAIGAAMLLLWLAYFLLKRGSPATAEP